MKDSYEGASPETAASDESVSPETPKSARRVELYYRGSLRGTPDNPYEVLRGHIEPVDLLNLDHGESVNYANPARVAVDRAVEATE